MAARPYVAKMTEVVQNLADSPEASDHPLFREVDSATKVAIIAITADRGLAGGYNSSIIRTVERMVRDHRAAGREVTLVPVGRKGAATSGTAASRYWLRSPGCPTARASRMPAR